MVKLARRRLARAASRSGRIALSDGLVVLSPAGILCEPFKVITLHHPDRLGGRTAAPAAGGETMKALGRGVGILMCGLALAAGAGCRPAGGGASSGASQAAQGGGGSGGSGGTNDPGVPPEPGFTSNVVIASVAEK